jgi:hypothetical protein
MAKRRKRSTAVAKTTRRRSTVKPSTRRRRKRSSGLGAGMKAPFMNMVNSGMGGLAYGVGSPMLSANPLTRSLIGLAGAFLLGYMNFPTMGNGMAGAAASELVKSSLGLNDEDLEDVEYTDVDLSGQELVTDEQGNVYSLGDGEQEPILLGNINDGSFSLSDNGYALEDYALNDNSGQQSVMMVPTYNN